MLTISQTSISGRHSSQVGQPRVRLLLLLLCGLTAGRTFGAGPSPIPVDFSRDVRPILAENCFACHGPDAGGRQAGLGFDAPAAPFRRLASGHTAMGAGRASASELMRRVGIAGRGSMPPAGTGKKLSPAQIETLRRWI